VEIRKKLEINMEVKKTIQDTNFSNHSIEWGNATWTKDLPEKQKIKSIRNRYNKDDGGFNYAGSAEVPWEDFNVMIIESIKNHKFSKEELYDILMEINFNKK
jgi:hypothetical protein